jgi:hypothetical protein
VLQEEDLTDPQIADATLDLTRAMNVLNASHFRAEQVRGIAARQLAALKEGGVFATGSNAGPGSRVDGGIYCKQQGRFRLMHASGDGSLFDREIQAAMDH